MSFHNDHATQSKASHEPQRIPVEMYAAMLRPETLQQDIRFAERQVAQGVPHSEGVANLVSDHVLRAAADRSTLSLVERYATGVIDLVRVSRDSSVEQMAETLRPSAQAIARWEALLSALGASQCDSLVWKREDGDIQSYQQTSHPHGWLHIDNGGRFFDRNARQISAQEAVAPLGLNLAGGAVHERGENKGMDHGSGIGMSM